MRINSRTDTGWLYIKLNDLGEYENSREVAPTMTLDFDKSGNVMGIEIHSDATRRVDLSRLVTRGFGFEVTERNDA